MEIFNLILQERLQWQRNLELNAKTQQATVQDSLDRKEKQIDELNSVCKKQHDTITQLENQIRLASFFFEHIMHDLLI